MITEQSLPSQERPPPRLPKNEESALLFSKQSMKSQMDAYSGYNHGLATNQGRQ